MIGFKLAGCGMALPEKVVTNDDMAKIVETSDEWISTRTGIKERRFCSGGETVARLAVSAAKKAIANAGIGADKIGLIIVATCTPENSVPSTACIVEEALGIQTGVPAFDINAACSGFLFALKAAEGLMEGADKERPYALLIGAERFSKILDMTDRTTCVLFGDGAGACVVKKEKGKYFCKIGAKGEKEALYTEIVDKDEHIKMDGKAIFRFAVKAIGDALDLIEKETGVKAFDADHIVCHQANKRILDHVAKDRGIDPEKFFKNLEKTGNTSAASIPIALADMEEKGMLKPRKTLILAGFGAGLTWGSALMECE